MKIAIYSRKSIETDRGDSIKNQVEMCKEYFLRREDNVTFEVFEDEGFSGGNTNRPSFQLLLQRIRNNEFDAVAVYKVDRIARNIVDFVNTYDKLDKLNVKLISITEGFDPSTPIGKMMMLLLASFAEMERTNIAQRVKDNMRELAKSGKWTGGVLPFGYTSERVEINNKKASYLKCDDNKKDLIKSIFSYYMQVQSMYQVEKWLSNNGLKICLSSVKNILSSPVYVKADIQVIEYLKNSGEVFGKPNAINGIIRYNKRPMIKGKHTWNDKSMFYAVSKHEGIIDASTWLKAQTIQNKNKMQPKPKESQISYLSGIIKCAKCGSPMILSCNHKKNTPIVYVYVCTGRKKKGSTYCSTSQIRQSIFDNKFEETLKKYALMDLKSFKKMFGQNDNADMTINIKTINKKITSNNKKIENLISQSEMLSGNASKPYLIRSQKISDENEKLKQELFLLKQEQFTTEDIPVDFIYNILNDFISIIGLLSIPEKRTWVSKFIKKITYNDDSMNSEITFL